MRHPERNRDKNPTSQNKSSIREKLTRYILYLEDHIVSCRNPKKGTNNAKMSRNKMVESI